MILKKRHPLGLFSIFSIYLFLFVFVNNVSATPSISLFLLNNNTGNVTFNPNNGESVSIEVRANTQVKFTRLYICSVDQICNGTSGNYTRYFTQGDISDTITKTWNGKKSGDAEIVTAGEYKVMVSMTEDSNPAVTEFGPYSIFVDFAGQSTSNDTADTIAPITVASSTQNTISNNSTNDVVKTRIVYVSAHSSTEDLSDYDDKTKFEITAGRERMALIGSPIEFSAKYSLPQKDECMPFFKWSFGDGFEGEGKSLIHTYKHIGEYHVVLNGICRDSTSISRTIVKVIAPDISIASISNGDIQILNKGKTEANIGGWKIKSNQREYVFPKDTIISVNGKITFSREEINFYIIDRVSLNNAIDKEVSYFDLKKNETKNEIGLPIETIKYNESTSTKNETPQLVKKVIKQEKSTLARTSNTKSNNKKDATAFSSSTAYDPTLLDNREGMTVSVLSSMNYSSSSSNSWLNWLDIPFKSFRYLANFFYDF